MKPTTVRCKFPIAPRRGQVKAASRSPAPGLLPGPCRAARLLSLAHHIEAEIESGEITDYAQAARALGLTRSRLTQVMNLLLLAPKIQERIAVGELVLTERALRRVLADPVWEQQRAILELS